MTTEPPPVDTTPTAMSRLITADWRNDQMAEAIQQMRDHRTAANAVDRRGWTRQQWIDDARQLMTDLHGSITSLVNGHVLALLDEVDQLPELPAPRPDSRPRPFALVDVTDTSDTAHVADGVLWPDGTATTRSRRAPASTAVWACLRDAYAAHGHDGRVRITWDEQRSPR